VFEQFRQAARQDTPVWMKGFQDSYYTIETLRGMLVSDQAYQASWNLAVTASTTAAVACISTWETDFRADLAKIDVPMVVIQGGPHAITWTHAEEVNNALLNFLGSSMSPEGVGSA
jgi:pimeloyl-ACP methyl ester carboxylesterase